jgi:hypothetical protein
MSWSALSAAALAFAAAPQDDAELARGQKYLDRIAVAWTRTLPAERVLAIYLGRKSAGHARLKVARAPEGKGGAAYEVTLHVEMKTAGFEALFDGRALLNPQLRFLWAEAVETENGVVTRKRVEAAGEEWIYRSDEGGGKARPTERKGKLRAATTWGGVLRFLPLFALPEDKMGVVVLAPSDNEGVFDFVQPSEKRTAVIGGKEAEFAVVEMREEGKTSSVCYLNAEGGVAEIRPVGSPMRLRPVAEEALGKDLDEPLVVRAPERAVVDFYKAIKRGDKEAVLAAFDIPRYAAGLDPEHAKRPADKRASVEEEIRKGIVESFLPDSLRAALPEEASMEDFLATGLESTVEGDAAEARLFSLKIKLGKASDGRWLIHAIEFR